MRNVAKAAAAALLVLAVVMTAVGCGGSSSTSTGSDSPGSAGTDLRIILVSHSPSTDPQSAIIANGLDKAGEDFGVSTEYRSAQANLQNPNEQRRVIEAAIAAKPDGLIVTDPFPRSLNPAIRQATDAGIPTVIITAGIGETEATGALTVIANDEYQSGVVGGERMKELGVTHPLVVTLPPGAVPLADERTNGFIKGYGGPVEQAQIPIASINNSAFIKNAVEAKLVKDEEIDGVFSLGSSLSPAVAEVKKQLGPRAEQITWSSIDFTQPVINALQDGTWAFALDQQQFSQSYLAVATLVMNAKYGITPASDFIPTGPAVVTPDGADRIAALAEKHVR